MKKNEKVAEILNSLTHLSGVAAGIVFLVMMIRSCMEKGNIYTPGFIIYGAFFIFLFLASALYHGAFKPKVKSVLRVFDHSAIFLFIAASYTPIILTVLTGRRRVAFLVFIWALAISGTIYKILSRGNYDSQKKISTALYIIMGWLAVFLLKPVVMKVPLEFLAYLIAGGVIYTVGTIFYRRKALSSHVIWHLFVLGAAITHFIGYYVYLI